VGGSRGFVIDAVDTGLLQGLDVGFCGGTVFFAAITDKDEFGFLFKSGHVHDVGDADASAAENTDVRESVEVCEGDCAGLHAAH